MVPDGPIGNRRTATYFFVVLPNYVLVISQGFITNGYNCSVGKLFSKGCSLPEATEKLDIDVLLDMYMRGDPEATVLLERHMTSAESLPLHARLQDVETSLIFTDVVDSSYFFEHLGNDYGRRMISIHDEIVDKVVSKRGGTVIKHIGDGVLASFASCGRSVKSAILIQKEVALHNAKYPLLHLQLRIGINVGDVMEEESDIYGTSVNLASRICSLAGSNKIFASSVVYERCKGKDYEFSSRGRFDVKGFTREVPIHEVIWQADGDTTSDLPYS